MARLFGLGLASSAYLFSNYVNASDERIKTEVRAEATLTGAKVSGKVSFLQERYTLNTEITGEVHGLNPGQRHGLQIHQINESHQPTGIYNPFVKKHGGPFSVERCVGDLGNLKADEEGKAIIKHSDPFVKLSGPFSVVGKVLAVHANPDDLGYGQNELSLITGNVGPVLAQGVISQQK